VATESFKKFREEGVGVRFVGQLERFSDDFRKAMYDAEIKSPENPRTTLWICLSYGGRSEIVQAVKKAVAGKEEITEDSLSKYLWTAGMPNPDLIIRTGGEQRLSNFLLWQSAYSELFFLKTYWPAFSRADLEGVLKEYSHRERRMGK
jgi:undecaprenyl diphosphate synthase